MSEAIYLISKDQYDHLKTQLELILKRLNYDSLERESKWLSTKETQELLKISQTTLWQYRKDGKIKASRIDKKLYFNREDIENMLRDNTS